MSDLLDELERKAHHEASDQFTILEIRALIQRLREWERISDDVLLLFTDHSQVPALRQHALTDAPFHAALRIIESYQERLREAEAQLAEIRSKWDYGDRLIHRNEQLERVREAGPVCPACHGGWWMDKERHTHGRTHWNGCQHRFHAALAAVEEKP